MQSAAVLPEWAQWFQALAPAIASVITAFVAIAVGVISYRQWRTAKEKLVLDLFERRFKVYERARSSALATFGHEEYSSLSVVDEMSIALSESTFLFDQDVVDYVTKLRVAMMTIILDQEEESVLEESRQFVSSVHVGFTRVAAPYMKLTHKL